MYEHPEGLTAEERLNEIAEIMANAVIRLKKKKRRKINNVSLDCAGEPSVHGVYTKGNVA